MRRLLAIFGGLLGALLVPLALAGPTAWLLIPAHLAFTILATVAAVLEGFAGYPERARIWGFGHLVATLAMVGALELGADLRDGSAWYWFAPWIAAAVWGWVPMVAAGLAGWGGEW